MKTVRNKTHAPVRVPLPRGKVLHLGPLKTGQISHKDIDHEPLQKLITQGVIALEGDSETAAGTHRQSSSPHDDTHGHHPPTASHVRGDRGG